MNRPAATLDSAGNLPDSERPETELAMHPFTLPEDAVRRSIANRGSAHVFAGLDPARTALVVVDMQNYFVAPGYMGEVPMARRVVPAINRLAGAVRQAGGRVVWIQTSARGADRSWSVLHRHLMTRERSERRLATMDDGDRGFALWPEMDARPGDDGVVKTRYSAFLQGSSPIEARLRGWGADTVLVAGTATNVCCESSARDAMMLDFKVAMVSDACAAGSDAAHAAALLGFYAFFGDVLTTDEAIAGLGGETRAPAEPHPAAARIPG